MYAVAHPLITSKILPCIILCICEAKGIHNSASSVVQFSAPPWLLHMLEIPSSLLRCQPAYALLSSAPVSAGDRMDEVYINKEEEPFVLEVDGRLDLSGLGLLYSSISLQGKKGLVDKDTGMTKRPWAELLQKLPSDSLAVLGTRQNPLQAKGVREVGLGGCRLLWCILQKMCVLPKSNTLVPGSRAAGGSCQALSRAARIYRFPAGPAWLPPHASALMVSAVSAQGAALLQLPDLLLLQRQTAPRGSSCRGLKHALGSLA